MLIFTHIPRTGGTTLRSIISGHIKNFRFIDSFSEFSFINDEELNSYNFIATHCGYGIFNRISRSHKKVIILRDPIERVISHYFYLRNLEDNVSYSSYYAKKLSIQEFIEENNPAVQISLNNTQTWHLVKDKNIFFRKNYQNKTNSEILDIAIDHLKTYDFIGITNDLSSVLLELNQAYGWDEVIQELPHMRESHKPDINEIDEKTINSISKKVDLDVYVYNKTKEILKARRIINSPESMKRKDEKW